ncbi:MAG TPA: hypothetical protein IAB01_06980 [Candidatus Avidesulfovibrio excrementigallinarum]|nr:hypothetical protein [Candidatus Avidesulfovibrio excrementigallinarum]
MRRGLIALVLCAAFSCVGCAVQAHEGVLDTGGESQLKLRQMQTRHFDTTDKQKLMECVLATLQDLGFVIDSASYELGTVSATKLSGYQIKMTVNAFPRGKTQMTVRANAQYQMYPIQDPQPYQQFFDALSKSLFLQANLDE